MFQKRIVFALPLRCDKRHKHAGEITERANFVPELLEHPFEPGQRPLDQERASGSMAKIFSRFSSDNGSLTPGTAQAG